MIYFTADSHFGHAKIIEYSNRPFLSVDEMDEALIGHWNRVVSPRDEVFHLGDFCWGNYRDVDRYLDRLNGKIHLIWGNHDAENVRKFHRWASSRPYAEINIQGTPITLCHYAHRVWNRSHYGALHLYGHSHGKLSGDRQSMDVGVDGVCQGRPWDLYRIKDYLETLPERGNNSA